MKSFIFIVLLSVIVPAHAGHLVFNWTPSTFCTDGTPIAQCPVTRWDLWSVPCTADNPPALPLSSTPPTATAPPSATSFDFQNTPSGTYCITVAPEFVVNGITLISQSTNFAIGTMGAPVLSTNTTVAYVPVLGNDHLNFVIVGSVPLQTPCDPNEPDGPFFVFPQAVVTDWQSPYNAPGVPKPTTVVGACVLQ